jgi:thermostable 8-oxoguanine DNA glycosylase
MGKNGEKCAKMRRKMRKNGEKWKQMNKNGQKCALFSKLTFC